MISCCLIGCNKKAPIEEVISLPEVTAEAIASDTEGEVQDNAEVIVDEITDESQAADEGMKEAVKDNDDFTESSAPERTDAVESPDAITLAMVGDILLHTPIENYSLCEDGTYDYSPIFANTKDLISAPDLALVNQEVIIGGKELGVSGYPAFNAPIEIGNALTDSGFDVVCHATNHALDKGKKGLTNCLSYWEEHHPEMEVLGIHDSAEDQKEIYLYKQGDITVAILNFTYGTNGISLPRDMPYGVDLLEKDMVLERIREAEAQADFTIVCPHWGTEYRLEPDESQKKWTKLFYEAGVDLVLGTHPHVIEPIEWIQEEASAHRMLVYYSLGNYVNWTSGTGSGVANRMVGGMAQITLERTDSGEVTIKEYGTTPLICHVTEGFGGVTVYPIESYSEELATANQIRSQDPAFSYEYCISLCDRVWGDLWHK